MYYLDKIIDDKIYGTNNFPSGSWLGSMASLWYYLGIFGREKIKKIEFLACETMIFVSPVLHKKKKKKQNKQNKTKQNKNTNKNKTNKTHNKTKNRAKQKTNKT